MKDELYSLELKISWFLRIGVVIAGLLLLVGFLANFSFHGDPFYHFQTYDKIPFQVAIQHHIQHGHWKILISYAGLIALISLPIARVLLTAFLFVKQKEYHLAVIALVVLMGLSLSFSLGIEL